MPISKKPLVFFASTALAVGVAVPGALVLSSGGERPSLPAEASPRAKAAVEAEHPKPGEHAEPEIEDEHGTEVEDEAKLEADDDDTKAPAAEPTTSTTVKVPGATGDAHRSPVAAEHSQADDHRAVAPGQPANGVRDDEVGEVEHENEGAEHQNEHATVEHPDDVRQNGDHGHSGEDRSGSNSGRG